MRLLVDAQTVIWAADDPSKLGQLAKTELEKRYAAVAVPEEVDAEKVEDETGSRQKGRNS